MNDKLKLGAVLAGALAVSCAGPGDRRPEPTASPTASTAQLPPGHPPVGGDSGPGAAPAETAGVRLSGIVELAPRLTRETTDVLYVMARKGGATLVARRIEEPAFPVSFELTDAHAMVSGVPLEGPVDIVARLSRSGDAIPAKGDLEGTTKGVPVPSQDIRVTIDTVRP